MKKNYIAVLVCLLFGLNYSWANDEKSDNLSAEEWVVVLDDPRPKRLQGWQRTGYRGGNNYRSAVELKRFGGRLAKDYNLSLKDQWLIESLGVYCLIVSFNDDKDKTIQALEKLKGVKWVQESNEFKLLSSEADLIPEAASVINLENNIGQKLSSDITGKGVTIAVVDSAVDSGHTDLASAVALTQDFVISGNGSDLYNNGEGEAHGTAIAGVMVAQTSSKVGIGGVAPQAKLLAYRGCWENADGNTNCNTLSLARALDAVARSGADILNLSLSGPKDILLDRLLDRVIANGTVVVAAFDPERFGKSRFPSEKEGVLIVRAEEMDSQFEGVFTAPGARVVATPGNGYDFMKGHSIATAYTSGVLALRKQFRNSILGSNKRAEPVDWREFSKSSRAKDLMKQLIDQSPHTNRALLTNQYVVVSN